MSAVGAIITMILIACGRKPIRYGWNWFFEFPHITWGLNLGIFFIAPAGNYISLKNHEHGHSIQNVYLGIFTPAVVALPSVVRFWYRELQRKVLKQPNKTGYSAIWFEGSADSSGEYFIESITPKNH